jgi:hypothetical protein
MVEREDVHAAIEARRELGQELEPQVIDAFVERIEKKIAEETRALTPDRARAHQGSFLITLASLILAVPITGIAATHGGIIAMIVVWAGIVIVNVVYNR